MEIENSKIKFYSMYIYVSSILKQHSLLFHLKYDKFNLVTKIFFFPGETVLLGSIK